MLPLAPDVFSGRQLGKYEVLCRLSTGGMAEIFLASQRGLAGFRKLVVLKQILPDIRGEEEFVRMFLDEAKVTAAFNHPNIAQVYDLDIAEGELFLSMEFVQGATLVEVAKACRGAGEAIPIGYTLAAVRDTAVALHYAHTFTDPLGRPSPVIHRDIAEKNIMVTYEGVTKLLDFGIAKSLARASRTQVGMVKGTSGYMSPEQILGEPLDARSDLFSLGVVLHECLTGMRLFYGRTPEAGMQAVLAGEVPLPSRNNKGVPPELDAIVLKSLARKREDRYASCLEFARALERAVGPLIWHPEQSGELMQRLFTARREQTRQLLSAGKMASGELTGEIRLAQLFGNNNPFATPAAPEPVAEPAAPPAPPVSLRPTAEMPAVEGRAAPLEQGHLPSTTPGRGTSGPRRTQAAVPASPPAEPSPAPSPAPAPPRRSQSQPHFPPPSATPPAAPSEDTGPIAPPTTSRRAPTPPPAPPPESPGPAQRRTRTAAQLPAQEEDTGPVAVPTASRRTQAAPPPPEDPGTASRRPAQEPPQKRPAPAADASRTTRAAAPSPFPRRPISPPPPADEEATVPQGSTARRVSRRPAAPPPPARPSGEESISITQPATAPVTDDLDDEDMPTLAGKPHTEHTVPGRVLPSKPGPKERPESTPRGARSRAPLVVAFVLVLLALAAVFLRLDGGLISSELPTLSELMTPSHNPGDLQPLALPEEDSPQEAPPAPSAPEAQQAPAVVAPPAPAADAGTPSPEAQAGTPPPAATPTPSEDDTLVPLEAPGPSEAGKVSEDSKGTKRQRTTAKRGKRPEAPEAPAEEPKAETAQASPTAEAGQLTLVVEPFAKVYLGNRPLGETPLFKVSLPAGRHSLRLVGPDGKARRLTVEIKPGDTTSLRMQLELLARE